MKVPIRQCPHCSSDEGYYNKDYVYGSVWYTYNFDGSQAENGDMYEYLNTKPGKIAYCIHCNKKIFKMGDLD